MSCQLSLPTANLMVAPKWLNRHTSASRKRKRVANHGKVRRKCTIWGYPRVVESLLRPNFKHPLTIINSNSLLARVNKRLENPQLLDPIPCRRGCRSEQKLDLLASDLQQLITIRTRRRARPTTSSAARYSIISAQKPITRNYREAESFRTTLGWP